MNWRRREAASRNGPVHVRGGETLPKQVGFPVLPTKWESMSLIVQSAVWNDIHACCTCLSNFPLLQPFVFYFYFYFLSFLPFGARAAGSMRGLGGNNGGVLVSEPDSIVQSALSGHAQCQRLVKMDTWTRRRFVRREQFDSLLLLLWAGHYVGGGLKSAESPQRSRHRQATHQVFSPRFQTSGVPQ